MAYWEVVATFVRPPLAIETITRGVKAGNWADAEAAFWKQLNLDVDAGANAHVYTMPISRTRYATLRNRYPVDDWLRGDERQPIEPPEKKYRHG